MEKLVLFTLNKNVILALVVLGILSAIFTLPTNVNADEVECEDISGEYEWDPEGHDDNDASEKRMYKMMQTETFCDVNKCIDHEECEGEIKEGTKHDMDWLEDTMYYQSVDEEIQENIRDAYFNSPDSDGDDNAADYELVESGY